MTLDRTPAHLCDMLDFVRELRALLQGLALRAYLADRVLTHVVKRLFINLGEAATRLEEAQHARFPRVPWRQIIGLPTSWRMVTSRWATKHCTARSPATSAVELALVEALALVTNAPPR